MYQDYLNNGDIVDHIRQGVLSDMYAIIGQSLIKGTYAFKGGYVLSSKVGRGLRRTHDIDITVLNSNTFELAISPIIKYSEYLKDKGTIWNYAVSDPIISSTRNKSGGIKLYIKKDSNTRKSVLCGVDMSIHNLDVGVEIGISGFCQYSNELMVADKVSAMYGTERNVLRRIRDIFDIYLLNRICNWNMNNVLVIRKVYERGANLHTLSTLELLYQRDQSDLLNKMHQMVDKNDKIDKRLFNSLGIDCNDVLMCVFRYLNELRKLLRR